jgi:hypothetical protein
MEKDGFVKAREDVVIVLEEEDDEFGEDGVRRKASISSNATP